MENVRNFVDLVALGDNIAAKEELDKILSQKSFDALDARKQQIAGAIFGTTEEPELDLDNAVAELEDEEVYAEDVEQDEDQEQLNELSKATLKRYATKANDSYHAAEVHKDRHKPMKYSSPSASNWDYKMHLDKERTKATKIMKKRAKGISRLLNRTNPGWDKD